jgi:hypothetical protein
MCGRFVRTATAEDIAKLFQLTEMLAVEPRYHIAPSQAVLAVRQTQDTGTGNWWPSRWKATRGRGCGAAGGPRARPGSQPIGRGSPVEHRHVLKRWPAVQRQPSWEDT